MANDIVTSLLRFRNIGARTFLHQDST